jgi:hypothetical protein
MNLSAAVLTGYLGVILGVYVLGKIMKDYPARGIGVAFVTWLLANYLLHFLFFPQYTDFVVYNGIVQSLVAIATAWYVFRLPPFPRRPSEAVAQINPKRPSDQQTKLKTLLNELESNPSRKPPPISFDAEKSGLDHRPPSEYTKPHPLTAYCMQLSAFENLLKAANRAMTDASSGTDKRTIVLFLIIMSAAGNFVEGIQRDEPFYKEMREYLRDTNPDVITAEAVVWITFLLGQVWKADQKKDREMFERVGYVTFDTANRLALGMIKSKTGFDFTASAIESRKLYIQSVKDGKLVEAFASVLFRSVGCRSLAEPLKIVAWPPLDLVWMHINIAVSIFFSSMPLGYYDTFKNMLRERSDLFPHDEEDDEDDDDDEDSRAEALVKQAVKMNWKIDVEIQKDGDPFEWIRKSVRFVRGNEEAVVWSDDGTVTLIRVHASPTFESFMDLENWLANNPQNPDDEETNEEILYLREIERDVIRMGHFEKMLETQATDELFFVACSKLPRAGYLAGEDATIVAALTLDALMRYRKSRKAALSFLARYLDDFQSKKLFS